jgi:hypothetical protein
MSFNDFDQQLYTTLTSGNYSSDHDYSNQLFELEEADRILNRLIDPLIGGATRSSTTSPTSFVLRQLSTSSTEMTKKPPTQLDFPSPVARMNSQDFANFASAYLADGKLPTMNTPSVEHKALPSSGVESSRLNYGKCGVGFGRLSRSWRDGAGLKILPFSHRSTGRKCFSCSYRQHRGHKGKRSLRGGHVSFIGTKADAIPSAHFPPCFGRCQSSPLKNNNISHCESGSDKSRLTAGGR